MEGIEMEAASPPPEDFCTAVLSQFSKSTAEHHLHICAAIGAMSQELKDQKLPLTPIAYFGATCSSLDRISSSGTEPQGQLVDALVTILSLVIDKFSPVVLKTKYSYMSELLVKILRSVGEDGVLPGLKCVSRMLIVREKAEWGELEMLYGVLIGYITDDRLKVRKQAQTCLREVLDYFHLVTGLAPLLIPASEAITNVFERFLLLAGGSNANSSEGPKGAQEVLYVLDALKSCLPYMSSKSSNNILKYFKTLLELRKPVVTRRITDCLNALCLHSTGEVSGEVLMDLLCSLANSVSTNESSADSMTITARLLDTGMKRVYSINRQICVVKLPVVFNALKDVLASEHEEALVAAVTTFKNLINSCIDESLIKQGVDLINVTPRNSGPTVIEKICATIESLLNYQFAEVWDMSFQIVSTMFDKLGKFSSFFLKETLKSLADMQKLPDEDFPFRKQLHECVGSALGAMGADTFLSLLPLKLDGQDLLNANLWLFPILKQYTIGSSLKFFTKSILPIIGSMKQNSSQLEQEGKMHSARTVDGIVYSLWSLLPSFCNFAVDTAENFKPLEKALCTALREEAAVRGIICSSLQILVQQNKEVLEGKDHGLKSEISKAEERAIAFYTSQVADANLSVLRLSARELLSVLSSVYFQDSKDIGGILQNTIGELASISDKGVVTQFFKTTMHKLLKVTQEEGSLSVARGQLFDLAGLLLPVLDADVISLLLDVIRPALKDIDGLIQKKAYRTLCLIFQGNMVFEVKKDVDPIGLPKRVYICLNEQGVHFFGALPDSCLHSLKVPDIRKIGYSDEGVAFKTEKEIFLFITKRGLEIKDAFEAIRKPSVRRKTGTEKLEQSTGSSQSEQIKQLQTQLASAETKLELSSLSEMQTRSYFEGQQKYISELQSSLAEAEAKIVAGENLRKKLHNTVLELKGNIRVFCRVRPLLPVDAAVGSDVEVFSFPTSLKSLGQSIDLTQNGQKHSFTFDEVFTPGASQEDVFVEISQLVQSALDGYKVCIFAYGQTGSGKTFTMMGKPGPDQKGLIPRSLEQVFETRRILQAQGWEYNMQVSMLEIYNETIRDLLAPNRAENPAKQCVIKHDANGNTIVSNLTIVDVRSSNEVSYLLECAAQSRSVGRTHMNEQSSRSHFVFTLRITGDKNSTDQHVQGVLNLIDLAGSQRLSRSGATGDRLKETQKINKSLSALSDVIFALAKKEEHVPFRNSKLTYLLQPCLGGDSKTLMFVNVSPEPTSTGESLCSLRFAARVNACEIGVPRRQTSTRAPD